MYYVGIDFGTTNSSIAIFNQQTLQSEVKVLDGGYGASSELMRTFLYYDENGEVTIEQISSLIDDSRAVTSLKRQLMKNPNFSKEIDGKVYTGVKLVGDFLQQLIIRAGLEVSEISRLVLSVPTHYTEELKNMMEEATVSIGIARENVWFVDEPIAVLWDYKESKVQGDLMLVFDFGGGTLDLAVMRKSENLDGLDTAENILRNQLWKNESKQQNLKVGKVLVKGGYEIGGDDIDEVIMKYFIEKGIEQGSKICERIDPTLFEVEERLAKFREHSVYKKLKKPAESCKIQLTESDTAQFFLPGLHPQIDRVAIKGTLDEKEFLERAQPIWEKIAEALREIGKRLEDTHDLSLKDIEVVLLSGGSSKVPLVIDIIEEALPNSRIEYDKNLQTSICRGNARYSYEDGEILVEDHINSAYGIYNHHGKDVVQLMSETDVYPFSIQKRIATTKPNQEYIEIIPMVRKGGDFGPIIKDQNPIYYKMRVKPTRQTHDLSRISVTFSVDKAQKLKITAYDNFFKETVGVREISLN